MKGNLGLSIPIYSDLSPEATNSQFERQQVIKPPRVLVFEETTHRQLIAELGKGESSDAAMMVLADRPNVGHLGWAILREWFDVVELDLFVVFDRVVIDETVEHTVSSLLRQNLLLLRIRKLSLQGSHS
jgi:hypothetical protein